MKKQTLIKVLTLLTLLFSLKKSICTELDGGQYIRSTSHLLSLNGKVKYIEIYKQNFLYAKKPQLQFLTEKYLFNTNGNILEKYEFSPNNGFLIRKSIFHYPSKNIIISSQYNETKFESCEIFTNNILKTSINSKNQNIENVLFDKNGQPIKFTQKYGDELELKRITLYSNVYDEKNNLIFQSYNQHPNYKTFRSHKYSNFGIRTNTIVFTSNLSWQFSYDKFLSINKYDKHKNYLPIVEIDTWPLSYGQTPLNRTNYFYYNNYDLQVSNKINYNKIQDFEKIMYEFDKHTNWIQKIIQIKNISKSFYPKVKIIRKIEYYE